MNALVRDNRRDKEGEGCVQDPPGISEITKLEPRLSDPRPLNTMREMKVREVN